jgi:ribosome-associated protein
LKPGKPPAGGATDDKPSRTQKKKRAEALQKTGTQLLSLSEDQLRGLQLPPELIDAIMDARKMSSRGALRRQLQYIGSLMRQIDAVRLEQDLDRVTGQTRREVRSFRLAEQWRDELIAGDRERLTWLENNFSDMDADLLRRLIQEAAGGAAVERRRSARAIFRYLRQFTEEER